MKSTNNKCIRRRKRTRLCRLQIYHNS